MARSSSCAACPPASPLASWRCSQTIRARPTPSPPSRAYCSCCSATPSVTSWPNTRAVATNLLSTVSHWLRRNADQIQDATFLDVPARLARVLLELATEPGSNEEPRPGAVIPDRMKQGELAALVGATRESINKWLGSFERQGLIGYDKGHITLLRPSALKQRIY